MSQNKLWVSSFLIAAALLTGGSFSYAGTTPSTFQYTDVQAFMRQLAAQYPQTTHLFDLGPSDSGQTIQGLAIGDPQSTLKNVVVSTHHGNEYGATEVAKAFATSIAQNPIQGQLVYVIPVLNISGYNAKNRYEPASDSWWDPNRDYPGPCKRDKPFHLKSTKAMADFIEKEGITASATLHTFSPAVVYPWGLSSHDLSTPYDDIFKMLVEAATVESHYETGNSTEVIYPADGAYEDYAFAHLGIWSLLYELGYSHTPGAGELQKMVEVNIPGLRRALEQSPRLRAEKHDFTGKCDTRLQNLDRHEE